MTRAVEVAASRWPRRAAYGAAGLAILLPTSTAGTTWFLASQVLGVEGARKYPVRVRGASGDRVTLTRTQDTQRSIPLGFTWPNGHARLGDVVAMDRSTVVREVAGVTRGALRAGIRGYSSSYLFDGDPSARGLDFETVRVPTALGDMPAWLVPPTDGDSDTWVVAVHGRAAPLGEALRILPTLAASGHPTLVVSYRNDIGAPPSSDRRFHLGHTEWQDIEPAIEYAQRQGAKRVILYGWSMGGAITLNLLRKSRLAELVCGLIMDCPVVDWSVTIQMIARRLNLPGAWTWTVLRIIERRIGVRLSELDQRPYADSLEVPTLIFVDQDDMTVAPWPTVEFAGAAPDGLVTLVETRDAGHCRSWNLDPVGYESAVRDFLKRVSPAPQQPAT
jgi:pimeloyl-ACP methyl ester carboxylesterase